MPCGNRLGESLAMEVRRFRSEGTHDSALTPLGRGQWRRWLRWPWPLRWTPWVFQLEIWMENPFDTCGNLGFELISLKVLSSIIWGSKNTCPDPILDPIVWTCDWCRFWMFFSWECQVKEMLVHVAQPTYELVDKLRSSWWILLPCEESAAEQTQGQKRGKVPEKISSTRFYYVNRCGPPDLYQRPLAKNSTSFREKLQNPSMTNASESAEESTAVYSVPKT